MALPFELQGQQDAMYSQYMFNGMAVNPAYAGSRDVLSITGLFRAQWLNVPGAPVTQNLAIHSPSRNGRYGFGLNLVNDHISYLGQTWVNGLFAYRIPTKRGKLALGLQGAFSHYRINWNEAYLINPNDQILSTHGRSLFLPNVGFGIYYNEKNWFAGASAPHLLVNSLNTARPGVGLGQSTQNLAILSRHFFLWGGVALPLSSDVVFRPTVLMKYVQAAPIEFDLTAHFIFKSKFWAGASFRTRDGILGMLQYQFTKQLLGGYAYDFPFTSLGRFTSGTHELMLRYEFSFGGEAVRSPRFF
ncbi:MAG: type IX secretion system membrane protein PorP/SprF [Bacteroidia bacterium]